MWKVICIITIAVGIVSAQGPYGDAGGYNVRDVPIPYSFRYTAVGDEGQSSHEETSDGSGRVQGSYSLSDAYGLSRVVEYVADEGGYRAVVRTNEPGTASINPADVIFESTADNQPSYVGGGSGQGIRGVGRVRVPY